jgi:hypothetical protein
MTLRTTLRETSLLLENDGKPARERLTLIRVFEELRGLGYEGRYDAVCTDPRKCNPARFFAIGRAAFAPLHSFLRGHSGLEAIRE